MTEHDIPLSAIVTPTEVIEVDASFPGPKAFTGDCYRRKKSTRFRSLKTAAAKMTWTRSASALVEAPSSMLAKRFPRKIS